MATNKNPREQFWRVNVNKTAHFYQDLALYKQFGPQAESVENSEAATHRILEKYGKA